VNRARVPETVIRQAARGTLLAAPDGPIVHRFDPVLLAQAIDQELARCAVMGWPKISLHMDVRDAMLLARLLRAHRKGR
jgi:hypothetical protein